MSDVKWIKILTDVFDDQKIRFIETMPNGDEIIVIWFKLICLAGKSNCNGFLMMTDRIAYTEEMLSSIFNRDIKLIQLAIGTFEKLDMVEVINDAIYITNWEKHQNAEKLTLMREQNKVRQLRYRENKRLNSNANTVIPPLLERNSNATDIDIDIDKEYIDKAKKPRNKKQTPSEDKNQNPKPSYGDFNNVFLSDNELAKLKAEFKDWEDRIERLSNYIEQYPSKGEKYSNHLATIRNWARRDKQEQPKQEQKIEW